MASGDWWDGELAIRSNRISVFTADGLPDELDTIIDIFQEKKALVGASLCWAIVVMDDGHPGLMLQSLPLPENSLVAKPPLQGDAPPILAISTHPLICNLFDGELAAGPVPILACAADERTAVVENPAAAHREIQRLAGVFGQPEYLLSHKDAAAFVKKPKPGTRDFPYKRRAHSPPPPSAAKKSKLDTSQKPGTNNNPPFCHLIAVLISLSAVHKI